MSKAKYPYEMRHTEHGRRIYHYWKTIHNDTDAPEFQSYPDFYAWAMSNGYTVGAKLFRRNEKRQHSKKNSYWVDRDSWVRGTQKKTGRSYIRERKWDATVNKIRRHYGMEPIHSNIPEYYSEV